MMIEIEGKVKDGLSKLAKDHVDFISNLLCPPVETTLSLDELGNKKERFWLVTSVDDSCSYRIAFNPRSNNFGLECTLGNGVCWYMGDYGDFDEAFLAM